MFSPGEDTSDATSEIRLTTARHVCVSFIHISLGPEVNGIGLSISLMLLPLGYFAVTLSRSSPAKWLSCSYASHGIAVLCWLIGFRHILLDIAPMTFRIASTYQWKKSMNVTHFGWIQASLLMLSLTMEPHSSHDLWLDISHYLYCVIFEYKYVSFILWNS